MFKLNFSDSRFFFDIGRVVTGITQFPRKTFFFIASRVVNFVGEFFTTNRHSLQKAIVVYSAATWLKLGASSLTPELNLAADILCLGSASFCVWDLLSKFRVYRKNKWDSVRHQMIDNLVSHSEYGITGSKGLLIMIGICVHSFTISTLILHTSDRIDKQIKTFTLSFVHGYRLFGLVASSVIAIEKFWQVGCWIRRNQIINASGHLKRSKKRILIIDAIEDYNGAFFPGRKFLEMLTKLAKNNKIKRVSGDCKKLKRLTKQAFKKKEEYHLIWMRAHGNSKCLFFSHKFSVTDANQLMCLKKIASKDSIIALESCKTAKRSVQKLPPIAKRLCFVLQKTVYASGSVMDRAVIKYKNGTFRIKLFSNSQDVTRILDSRSFHK